MRLIDFITACHRARPFSVSLHADCVSTRALCAAANRLAMDISVGLRHVAQTGLRSVCLGLQFLTRFSKRRLHSLRTAPAHSYHCPLAWAPMVSAAWLGRRPSRLARLDPRCPACCSTCQSALCATLRHCPTYLSVARVPSAGYPADYPQGGLKVQWRASHDAPPLRVFEVLLRFPLLHLGFSALPFSPFTLHLYCNGRRIDLSNREHGAQGPRRHPLGVEREGRHSPPPRRCRSTRAISRTRTHPPRNLPRR